MKQKNGKKKSKIRYIIIVLLVLLGVGGGIGFRVFFSGNESSSMPNDEANRLIRYLGLGEYEYSDRLGSYFTVGDAKRLLDAADISKGQVEGNYLDMPNFTIVSRKQFEELYATMVSKLEIERLRTEQLYIYSIDAANDREIDGIVYEVVNTNNGDFYVEKDYRFDHAYVGKIVNLYVSNNEIILCKGEADESLHIQNVYAVKIAEEDGEKLLYCYANSKMIKFPIASNNKLPEKMEACLCDVVLSNKGVSEIVDHTKELVEKKVLSYMDGIITVEGEDEPLVLSDSFNVYKAKGAFKASQSAGTLIGYDRVSLLEKDGVLEAAMITEDIYSKNIRVVLNNTDYTGYYHNRVMLTSDAAFIVKYAGGEDEYQAGEVVELTTGSNEFKAGIVKAYSKEEDGRVSVMSIERQSGAPAYRGTLELKKSDQGILIVNELPVEEYLYGVVPSEMPVSYEAEALKVQAICARAYAYRQMESDNYAEYGAHLDDSIACQVYNNVAESDRSNFAVDDTYGVVPCYGDEVIEAFFFSTSCGTTSNNAVVWGGNPQPYLLDTMETELNDIASLSNEQSFKDFIDGKLGVGFIEEQEPFFRWSVAFSQDEISESINSNLYNRIQAMEENLLVKNADGRFEKKAINSIGTVQEIKVTKRGDSGIIEEMQIVGSEHTILVKGQSNARSLINPQNVTIKKQDGSSVKNWASLPSAYFYIDSTDGFVIKGGGFGHGVGMSQNGANDMAKLGYTARAIVEHYYTAVELKDMYEMLGK